MTTNKVAASFRDPSGFIYRKDGGIYRQVNQSYRSDFDLLVESKLYERLVEENLLIPHREVTSRHKPRAGGYKVIKPELVKFISYPYEWSYSQLKDAALITLKIQKIALEYGMSLKDSSAYNIQFHNGRPILIDTLSFEKYQEGKPWVAYRQFCQHFLAPLALMAYTDIRLQQLMKVYIDGIPLDLASRLLPSKTKFRLMLASHIHMHARSQQKYADRQDVSTRKLSLFALNGLIDSLASLTKSLEWKPKGTEWGEYYTFTNYSSASFKQKRRIIEDFIAKVKPNTVWDIGANNGLFSRIASASGIFTVASDIDPAAVEKNYRQVKAENEIAILPLLIDLTNPSPALGWAHSERESFMDRGPADMVFALALIHHICISNNVPLEDFAKFLSQIARTVVIEFVPKGDSQVDKLLATRKDIFTEYSETGFEKAFGKYFKINTSEKIRGSKRTIYLLEQK